MSNARKISRLVVGTELKITNVDSDITSTIANIKTRLDSDDNKIQSMSTSIISIGASSGLADSDLKVVGDLRNQLDSEIVYVRNLTVKYTNYLYVATAGQTSFTGTDSNSLTLAYTAGAIQVFLNGILLTAEDFTATDGTTIVLTEAAQLSAQLIIIVPKLESNYVAPIIIDWGAMQTHVVAPQRPGTQGQGNFGAQLSMSSTGEYAAVTAWQWTADYSSSKHFGGFKIYKNNSSGYSDSTEWNKVASLHKNIVFSGGPSGATFSGLDTNQNGQRFGFQPIHINEDASKIVITHIPFTNQPQYQSSNTWTMFVLSRTDSDFTDYASFNLYKMASDTGDDNTYMNSQSACIGRHFGVDKNVERIAYYIPKRQSGVKLGGVVIVKRTGTTFALEAQFDADDANQTGIAPSTYGSSNSPDMGASGVVMSEDGDKVVCSNRFGAGSSGRRGAVWTFTRSGTSWSMPNGGTIYDPHNLENNYGKDISLSKDGNYLAVASSAPANSSNNNNEVKIYKWNSSTNAWDEEARVQPGLDGGPSFSYTDEIGPVALNRDGTVLGMLNPNNDDSDNGQANSSLLRIYKRSGTSWSLVNHKFGADLFSEVSSYNTSHGTSHQMTRIAMSDSGASIILGASDLTSDRLNGASQVPKGCVGILHDS